MVTPVPGSRAPDLTRRSQHADRLPRNAALDGLRGLAVAAVVLFHGGVTALRGGFLGVDAFFVLSGYLITSLLLRELEGTGRIALGAFWGRRVRRLLPSLLLVIAVVALLSSRAFRSLPSSVLRGDAWASLAYVANWRFAFRGAGYFVQSGPVSPLQHLWSLAIEEQFYLVWPLVLLGLVRSRRFGWRVVVVVGSVGAVLSAVVMSMLAGSGRLDHAFYGTDARAQAVLVGAAVAGLAAGGRLDRRAGGRRMAKTAALQLAGCLGLAVVAALVWRADGSSRQIYHGGFLVFSVATGCAISAVVVAPAGRLARALGSRPLVVLGRLSYALYLWHWPVDLWLTAARTGLTGAVLLALRVAVSLALAFATTLAIERPVQLRLVAERRGGTWAATAVALVLIVIAVSPHRSLEVPVATSARAGTAVGSATRAQAAAPPGVPTTVTPTPMSGARRTPHTPPRVLLIGDSVALTLGDGMVSAARQAGLQLTDAAVLGCGIARGGPLRYFGNLQGQPAGCDDWPSRWQTYVSQGDPDVVLMLVGRWEVMDRMHDGRWTHIGDPSYDRYLASELDRAIDVLQARGAAVAVATAPCYHRGERPDGGLWPEDTPDRVNRWNALLRDVVSHHRGPVTVVDLFAKLCPGGRYTSTVGGIFARYDGVHLTPKADRWLAPWLLPQLDPTNAPWARR